MRREITEVREITKTEEVVVGKSACCNKCGKEFKQIIEEDNYYDEHFWDAKVQSFSAGFGYGSKFDNEHWSFDLCEDCLLEVIKTFKHVPKGFMEDEYVQHSEERHQQIFENWKQTDEWEDFKYHTYEELLEYKGLFKEDYFEELVKKYHPDKVSQY